MYCFNSSSFKNFQG